MWCLEKWIGNMAETVVKKDKKLKPTPTENLKPPKGFQFTPERAHQAQRILKRYPQGAQGSGVIPLLRLAQEQNGGWLSPDCLEYVAGYIQMSVLKVWEVASFYTQFNLHPVGKHVVQICRTTPCWLRGAEQLTKTCLKHLNIGLGHTTPDQNFTVMEVECLGACANAPMVQINDDYYEDLDENQMLKILEALKRGDPIQPGSQQGRKGAEPHTEPLELENPVGPAGFKGIKSHQNKEKAAGKDKDTDKDKDKSKDKDKAKGAVKVTAQQEKHKDKHQAKEGVQ